MGVQPHIVVGAQAAHGNPGNATRRQLRSGDGRQVRDVYVGGKPVVTEGRAIRRDRIERDYADAMREIMRAIDE